MESENSPKKKHLARYLRKSLSDIEVILWSRLKGDQIGFRVRRQFEIAGFIVDFYIPKAKLAVELDGRFHNLNDKDQDRDRALAELGILTIRFVGSEFGKDIDHVVRVIHDTAEARCRHLGFH